MSARIFHRRFRVVPLAASLGLGVLTTVAVAWAFAAWGTAGAMHGQQVRPPAPPGGGGGTGWGELAPERVEWPIRVPPEWDSPKMIAWSTGIGLRWDGGTAEFMRADHVGSRRAAAALSAGWPLRAMQWRKVGVLEERAWDTSVPSGLAAGLRLPGRRSEMMSWGWFLSTPGERRLPLLPVWPGFAVNTALAAVVFWVLWAGAGWTRRLVRARRVRRGGCPACGYPVGALGACPECGAENPPVARQDPAMCPGSGRP